MLYDIALFCFGTAFGGAITAGVFLLMLIRSEKKYPIDDDSDDVESYTGHF